MLFRLRGTHHACSGATTACTMAAWVSSPSAILKQHRHWLSSHKAAGGAAEMPASTDGINITFQDQTGTLRAGRHGSIEDSGVGPYAVRGNAVEQLQRQLPLPGPLRRADQARVRDGVAPVPLANLHSTDACCRDCSDSVSPGVCMTHTGSESMSMQQCADHAKELKCTAHSLTAHATTPVTMMWHALSSRHPSL